MSQEPQQNKFTAEIIVFSVVALVCMHSAYLLLAKTNVDRSPSSKNSSKVASIERPLRQVDSQALFEQYKVKCNPTETVATKASKIRLTGQLCGRPSVENNLTKDASISGAPLHEVEYVRLATSQIENVTTQYNATVFLDAVTGEFSTDFIQLEPGTNKIKILFVYENKRSVPMALTVVRQELVSADN